MRLLRRAFDAGKHSSAIVPGGWALMNAVWLWVHAGFSAQRPTDVSTTLGLYLSAGSIAVVMILTGLVTMSGWRHPADRRVHHVSRRGDVGIYAALGAAFAGLTVIYGLFWLPFAIASVLLALFILVRDARIRARLRG